MSVLTDDASIQQSDWQIILTVGILLLFTIAFLLSANRHNSKGGLPTMSKRKKKKCCDNEVASTPSLYPSRFDHPSVDTTNRFALDQLFREPHGFRIYSRPKNKKDNIWIKDGVFYTEKQILEIIPNDDIADAIYLQDLYYSGYML